MAISYISNDIWNLAHIISSFIYFTKLDAFKNYFRFFSNCLSYKNSSNVFKTTKILETNKFSKNFLEDCVIKLPKTNNIENKNFKLQYGCISQNGKLVCGNKYK